MTIKETIAAVRETGCRCTWDSQWGEFKVTSPDGGTYFTDDGEDAVGTAKDIMKRLKGKK